MSVYYVIAQYLCNSNCGCIDEADCYQDFCEDMCISFVQLFCECKSKFLDTTG